MEERDLVKLIHALTDKWKSHFGLYTQYVGYLTPELVITLLTVWRTSDPNDFKELSGDELIKLINEKVSQLNEGADYKYKYFKNDEDVYTVAPKLIDLLNDYDLTENNLPKVQWDEFINYLATITKY